MRERPLMTSAGRSHVVVGVGLAMHVAVHDDALAALLHHGGLRDAHRDRVGFALAHRAGRGDVVRVVVREVLGVLAFQAVDGAP
ncbi:hypothetical protein G6F63_016646 [Rhizopus arrhizus]|nr:hypothetical protein G6F63_016646 [Rhizopus arrhizus]